MPRQERRKDRTVPIDQVLGARGGITTEIVEAIVESVEVPDALTDFADFPSTYTGNALKFTRANAGATALEFAGIEVEGENGIAVSQFESGVLRFTLRYVGLVARALCTTNMDLSGTETPDGVSLSVGEIAFCIAQTTAHQNGPWVVSLTGWERPDGWQPRPGETWTITEGTVYHDTVFQLVNNTAPTLGSDSLTWRRTDGRWIILDVANANITVPTGIGRVLVRYTSLGANRTVTLPRAASGNDGIEVWIRQVSAPGAFTIAVVTQGTETLTNYSGAIGGGYTTNIFLSMGGNWEEL